MNKKKAEKEKKNVCRIFSRIFMVLTIVGVVLWSGIYATNYYIGEEDTSTDNNGNVGEINATKKEIINALICGVSENNSDTIMYVRYNVRTGKLALMSIPRDTYVTVSNCYSHKINALYSVVGVDALVDQVENLLQVDIDYYAVVDTKVVREVVDAIGGVEVNVPIRMKYDDPSQNLHIDLQPGVQILDGIKAEHFIRFRHSNDFKVQYPRGDLGRTEAQQEFVKALLKTAINPVNITKIPGIIKATLDNTETNVTVREALRYTSDIPNLKLDSIFSCTAEGTTPYIDNISYFKMDLEKTRKIIKEEFITKTAEDIIPTEEDKTADEPQTNGAKPK